MVPSQEILLDILGGKGFRGAMKDITEIRRAHGEELLAIAKQRITMFSILRRIYDNDYLLDLSQRKHDYDNLLLFWLVIDNPIDRPIAIKLLREIEENLGILKEEESIRKFGRKLRQWKAIPFESSLVELELAAEYRKRGFGIEIEPVLPNNRKGDFCVTENGMRVYFEVKMIYWGSTLEQDAITNELLERLRNVNKPFAISIDIKRSFQRNQTIRIARYVKRKLEKLEPASVGIPYSFAYPPKGQPIVVIDIISILDEDEPGFVSGFVYGGGIKGDWSDLRSKISSGVSQLHPDYPGVIAVSPHGIDTTHLDIRNALFGDLKVNIHGRPRWFRGGDRVFGRKKNRRLSAVVYYRKRLHETGYSRKKFVYHNPYAKTRLSSDFFKGKNVTQFIPIHDEKENIRYEEFSSD